MCVYKVGKVRELHDDGGSTSSSFQLPLHGPEKKHTEQIDFRYFVVSVKNTVFIL